MMKKSKEIVEKLVSLKLLDVKSISQLVEASLASGRDILEEAMVTGLVSADALPFIFSQNFDIPYAVLKEGDVDVSLAAVIPSEIAWGEEIIPLSVNDQFVTVGVHNPLRPRVFRRIEGVTGKKVRVALVGRDSLQKTLMRLYPPPLLITEKSISGELSKEINVAKFLGARDSIGLVSEILYMARIEGIEVMTLHHILGKFIIEGREDSRSVILLETPGEVGEVVFSGLKKLCGFHKGSATIEERIVETGKGKRFGMYKVALISGAGAKKAVVKVIPNALGKLSIENLGFDRDQLESITGMIRREKGVYVIASPLYDGVSTTLYSMVRHARDPFFRIVAMEEDIRYKNEGFIQIEKKMMEEDLSIEKIVRTLSPDILMYDNIPVERLVSEMGRIDSSRMSIFAGIQSQSLENALQGIVNPEISPYVLASSMKALVFQKLVRILCDVCKKELPAIPSMYLSREMIESDKAQFLRKLKYFIPTGCEVCDGTGYTGKTALFDLMVFSPSVRMELLMDKPEGEKREKILSLARLGPEESVVNLLMDGRVTFEDALPFIKSFT